MKNLVTIFAAILLSVGLWAQSPTKMSYQAVIRDAADELVLSKAVGMKISIIRSSIDGSSVYVESQTPTTNKNGLIGIEIGEGTPITGSFDAIDWSDGPFFIKTEFDPSGGTTYTISGTSQLLSVPYALYATDVKNKDDADADSTNEIQTLSLDANELSISDGNSISLPEQDTVWNWNDSTVFVMDEFVGIGINKPRSELDVKGVVRSSSATNRYLTFDGQNADGNAYINYRTISKASRMGFQINGVSRMTISGVGNVGIGTTFPTSKLSVKGNMQVDGDLNVVNGVIKGEISIDSVHVSQITGLLGQGYSMMLPDVLNNYVLLEITNVILTEKVIMVGSLGHETERISTPWKIHARGDTMYKEAPGLSMEFPIVFETGNAADVSTLKNWFDSSPDPQSGSVIIKNLAGIETDRWNYYEYVPDSYESAADGRTRFKMKHNLLPNNIVGVKYEEGDFGSEHSYNPLTDKLFEMNGITHSEFTPQVEVDYRARTITITVNYQEGAGLALWAYTIAAGTESPRSGSIIETTNGMPATEISRRNFFECIPIRYEVFYGFGQDIKLKARLVIAFGFSEDAI